MISSKSLRHFAKNLFLMSKIHVERSKAKQDVDNQLDKMRKAIIRMSLSYTDIDKLKEKIENLIKCERKYAKSFRPEDEETKKLRNQINVLELELTEEKKEKGRLIEENNKKIQQLTESLNNTKNNLKHLHLEKAKREHRLRSLEHKIKQKVDVHSYYHS